jgi:ABC-type transport system involved in multi-copper enzyme maturation permease subunit
VTFIPVIERELRASSRQAFTYYLRAIGVAAVLLASLLFGLDNGFAPNLGSKLFGSMHFTLFCAIWILVPLLTADCISRERREGTLGLLFLTRLRGADIVIAKGLAHGLRAVTLWIAVLPVVVVPFMLGGLSASEVLLSLLVNTSAICWALAAGLLASTWSKSWTQAVLRAAFLSGIFLLTMSTATGVALTFALSARRGLGPRLSTYHFESQLDYLLALGMGFISNAAGRWEMSFLRVATPRQLLSAVLQVALLSILALVAAILVAGARTRRIWQEPPPSPQRLWVQKTFTTPIFWLSFFKRWMRRKLERNPIGWLEQRTWTGRLVTWGWFAVIISIYSAVFTDRNFFHNYSSIQKGIGWLLSGSLALSAAGSFRRERESGVLELLLVSPVGEAEILFGRLRGLWGQFFPAFGMLLGIWMYFSALFPGGDDEFIWFFGLAFFTLPVIGLYYSLKCRHFMTAFISTILVGLGLPLVGPGVLRFVWWLITGAQMTPALFVSGWACAAVQISLAAFCWNRLYHRLVKRAFPLERGESQ